MKFFKPIISALLFVVMYLFWALPYRSALAYQEQFQLFLLTPSYLQEHISMAGGMAIYISEFLVQFYNNYWIGAAIAAAMTLLAQLLTWQLCLAISKHQLGDTAYVLSALPAILLWWAMGDIDLMPAYTIAFLCALAAVLGFFSIRQWIWRLVYAIVAIPLFYWTMGPTPYYFRSPTMLPWPAVALPIVTAIIVLAIIYLPETKHKLAPFAIAAGIAAIGWACHGIFYNSKVYELVEYDYLLRTNNWKGIIHKAEQQQPDLPGSVSATNLALAMTGQLDTRAFDFYQNTAEGLFPSFQKDPNSSMMAAEIYFQLGLINTAQRLYFEGMEAIPNYNKSTRAIKRLAETNMLRGNYQVARKYLHLLEHTTMYKKWAQRTMQLIDNPQAIDKHPLYGELRHRMLDQEYFYSEGEIDKILGHLFLKDSTNTLALQYLLMFPLLQRDLDKFMQYVQVIQQRMPYKSEIMQQGVAFAMMKAGMEIPAGVIDPAIMSRFRSFAQTYAQHGDLTPFRNTLWYYLTVNE